MPIRKALITRICKKKLNTKNQEGLNKSQEINYTQGSMSQQEGQSHSDSVRHHHLNQIPLTQITMAQSDITPSQSDITPTLTDITPT